MNVVDIINKAIARDAVPALPSNCCRRSKETAAAASSEASSRLIGFDPAYINVTFHREGIKQAVRPDGSVEWHVVRRRPGTVGISAAIQNELRRGGRAAPDLRRAVEIRHRGRADRPRLPRACTTCWRCAATSRRTKSSSCPIRRDTRTPSTSCGRSRP